MVPDGRTEWTDGRRQNYIPPTSSGDNNDLGTSSIKKCESAALSCQHRQKELCNHLMLRQNISEIMLRDQKLLNINSFNKITKFKNIRNISV